MFEKEKEKSLSGHDTLTHMLENTTILQYLSIENVVLVLWVWFAALSAQRALKNEHVSRCFLATLPFQPVTQ